MPIHSWSFCHGSLRTIHLSIVQKGKWNFYSLFYLQCCQHNWMDSNLKWKIRKQCSNSIWAHYLHLCTTDFKFKRLIFRFWLLSIPIRGIRPPNPDCKKIYLGVGGIPHGLSKAVQKSNKKIFLTLLKQNKEKKWKGCIFGYINIDILENL